MKLTWLTDIHLNFLEPKERKLFYNNITNNDCDGILITGDIAEASSIVGILKEMRDHIEKPIYFVLGNHDYYRGQINEVRSIMTSLTQKNDQLFWLPALGTKLLSNETFLLGQDGWADGRLGDYQNSNIGLNDSRLIADLFQAKILGKTQLLKKMQELADEDALQMKVNLIQALKQNPNRIIVLTHIPPFKEVCTYQGKQSNDDWLPFFSSKIMGDVLIDIAKKNPNVEFLVLCGHTHGEAKYYPLKNLTVKAGKSEYYNPELQEMIII